MAFRIEALVIAVLLPIGFWVGQTGEIGKPEGFQIFSGC
jgi:hypothetical protein